MINQTESQWVGIDVSQQGNRTHILRKKKVKSQNKVTNESGR